MSGRSALSRLYNGETSIDFVGRKRLWFALSTIVILAGLGSLFTRGLNLGIDFEGGTVWEVPAGDASVGDARDALSDAGYTDTEVQTVGSGRETRLRVQARVEGTIAEEAEREDEVTALLADVTGADVDEVAINAVGPSWGDEITRKAQRALVFFLIAITIYITLRFEWKMAVATLVALVHDILVTVGVYSLAGFSVTPATVIAILTILGYSIYDGIVVFDKVDENAKLLATGGRTTYSAMVNDSLNQVLMRTLNTSITALIPITSLLVIGSFVLGATTLEEFALALLIGLGSGAFSSIFIASPVLALLKERESRYAAMRKRVAAGGAVLAPAGTRAGRGGRAAATTGDGGEDLPPEEGDEESAEPVAGAGPARPAFRSGPSGPVVPRGRKKGRRR